VAQLRLASPIWRLQVAGTGITEQNQDSARHTETTVGQDNYLWEVISGIEL
jgi:hypothetical protein